MGFSWGEQGGSGTGVTFGGTASDLATCQPAPSRSEEDQETIRWIVSPAKMHRVGVDGGQDQREGGFDIGPRGAEGMSPFVALILHPGRALAAHPPAMTEPPLSHRRASRP
jgi:hypothetical protein